MLLDRRGNLALIVICSFNVAVLYPATKAYYMWRNQQRDRVWNAMSIEVRSYIAWEGSNFKTLLLFLIGAERILENHYGHGEQVISSKHFDIFITDNLVGVWISDLLTDGGWRGIYFTQ